MGMAKFRPLRGSKTHERISMKLGIYMSRVWAHMQIHMALRQRGWSRLARDLSHVSVSWYNFFFIFKALFFSWRPARSVGPILTINTPYDVFPRNEVPSVYHDETAPHLGGQILKLRFWGRE